MSLSVIFRRVARNEFDDAADWYEQRLAGLGAAFTAAIQQTLDQIIAQPDFYPTVFRDVREALVSNYPYCIYYRDETSRDPVCLSHSSRSIHLAGGSNSPLSLTGQHCHL